MPLVMIDDNGDAALYEYDHESWIDSCGRVLLNGAPLSGKTTGATTFPGPRHFLIAPRELGHTSVVESKEQKVWTFRFPTTKDASKYQTIWRIVQELSADIIAGTHGDCTTLVLDGLHKYYHLMMKALGYRPGIDTREFGTYHPAFLEWLEPILTSSIPFIVATCYEGQEPLEDFEGGAGKKSGIFVGLPGRMAKEIMGSFPLVFHTERYGTGKKREYWWRFQPNERIHGAGGHFPKALADAFPELIKPDWSEVVRIIQNQTNVNLNKEIIENETTETSKATRKRSSATSAAKSYGTGKRKR